MSPKPAASSTRLSLPRSPVTATALTTSPAPPISTTSSSRRCRSGSAIRTSCSTWSSASPSSATESATAPRFGDPVERRRDPLRARRCRPDAGKQGIRSSPARLPLLLHDPLPGGSRGRAVAGHPPRRAQRRPRQWLPEAARRRRHRGAPGNRRHVGARDRGAGDRPGAARAARGPDRRRRRPRPLRGELLARLPARPQALARVHACPSRLGHSAGSAVAFAGLGFTAVYREGFETVLFYQALGSSRRASGSTSRSGSRRPWPLSASSPTQSSSSGSGCR